MAAPVGLLAGGGAFPAAFAEAARRQGLAVVCVAIRGHADADLQPLVQQHYWTGIAKLGRMIRCFRRAGVRQVVMAGKIHKVRMFDAWRVLKHLPDWRMLRFWLMRGRRDNKDDSLLLGVINEFERDGMACVSALDVCPELLAQAGVLAGRTPTPAERRDIAFGWALAKEMGRLDVGQSVCVKERAAIAVEAIEGTDQAILRAGQLCPAGGFTVVKVAKPQQDMRFDVPTIGPNTIASMKAAGATLLAIEAGKTIVLDRPAVLRAAADAGIAVVACAAAEFEQGTSVTEHRQAG
jgi:hypothetical protein